MTERILLKDFGMRETSPTDPRLRRRGKFLCTVCHLNAFECRFDSPRTRCDDCIAEVAARRKVCPTAGQVFGDLTFLEHVPTSPPKYRNYAKFRCACGMLIEAEVRRVVSGARVRCGRKCKHSTPPTHPE
jgi:hypothetical protein